MNGRCRQKLIETFGEYKWTISNFSSFREEIRDTDCFTSPIFSTSLFGYNCTSKWQLELYPDGTKNNKGYVCILLKSLTDINAMIDFEISISSISKLYYSDTFSHLFRKNTNKGFSNCIEIRTLLNELKENDKLLVFLKITFPKNFCKANFQINIAKDIASLLDGDHCDVTLTSSDGIEYKAHKLILMCRSKVFLAMFQHTMKESQDNVVKIEDVDSDTLNAILQFIYTGEVECMQGKAEKVIIAADKYELNDLTAICVYHISKNMTNNNILDLIKFSHDYNINALKLESKHYFLKHRKIIMSTMGRQKIKLLSRDILETLLCDVSTYESK